jgi:hypothetical protein
MNTTKYHRNDNTFLQTINYADEKRSTDMKEKNKDMWDRDHLRQPIAICYNCSSILQTHPLLIL